MFAIAPGASWAYWRKDAFDVQRAGKPLSLSNQSIHALFGRAHLSTSGALFDLCVLIVLGSGLAVAVVAYRSSSSLLGVLVCAATALLVSPISWWHHYVWIIPVLAWLAFSPDRPKRGEWWAVGAAFLFVIEPLKLHGLGPLMGLANNDYVTSALVFVALIGCMLWTRHRRVHRPTLLELTS
jgi:alpha-1,2-mannosyltransferase